MMKKKLEKPSQFTLQATQARLPGLFPYQFPTKKFLFLAVRRVFSQKKNYVFPPLLFGKRDVGFCGAIFPPVLDRASARAKPIPRGGNAEAG